MKIDLTLNGTSYHIEVEPSCFTPFKHGKTEKGADKVVALGYPSTLSRAINMICREELASSDERVSLMEFVERYETMLHDLKYLVDFEA